VSENIIDKREFFQKNKININKNMKIIEEFKKFAMRGNVVDLAVGVIIGGAFGKIVTSFVNDMLMPPIGVILGGVNFTKLSVKLGESATLNYGNFLQTVVDFLIIAWAVFMVVKAMNKIKKDEPEKEEEKTVSEEVRLLTEIRDSLKKE
jgi:large conductance mechanosensitive channel